MTNFSVRVTVTVNWYAIFQLTDISVTVTVNLNHFAFIMDDICCKVSAVRMSSVPPCYADLGKSAKDLFSKGFSESIM